MRGVAIEGISGYDSYAVGFPAVLRCWGMVVIMVMTLVGVRDLVGAAGGGHGL